MASVPHIDGGWQSLPPPDASERFIPILTPKVGLPVNALIVGSSALGTYVHWVPNERQHGSGRTVPHTTPDDTCPICVERNQRPRWHGYLAAWQPRLFRYCIIDCTVHCVQSCPDLSPASGLDLRGMSVLLKRVGTSNNSPVIAELDKRTWPVDKIPADFDVYASLLRVWGLTDTRNLRLDDLRS